MKAPLEGLRVLDFGHWVAGPLVAMMLSDLGADVVRVDRPGADPARDARDAVLNRGKRRLTLDLKEAAGRVKAFELASRAEVLIENFRPGVMERLELGWDRLREANPSLIYCSIPGFGRNHPRAAEPGWEGTIAALTGVYRPATYNLGAAPPAGSDAHSPVYTAIPIASNFAALNAMTSILAALVARRRDGIGQRIEASLLAGMVVAFGRYAMKIHDRKATGRPEDRYGGGAYRCRDGAWVIFSTFNPKFLHRLAQLIDPPDGWPQSALEPRALDASDALVDRLREAVAALFATRSGPEWEDFAVAHRLPIVVCRSMEDWLSSAHAAKIGAALTLEDPHFGRTTQPGAFLQLSHASCRPAHPRQLGSDPGAAFREPASAEAPRKGPDSRRPPLAGHRVLDLSQVFAGPLAGRILAELGAEVIKINPPEGTGLYDHLHLNRAKQSILLDIREPAGRRILDRLIARSDVFLHSFPPDVVERLDIAEARLRRDKADLIYASVTGFGAGGPWSERLAYEPHGQAATGMMHRFSGGDRPVMQPYPINDYASGMLCAISVLLAVLHRSATGEGQHAQSSLAHAATFHQSALCAFPGGSGRVATGLGARGDHPFFRLYKAADAWFFLAGIEDSWKALEAVEGLEALGTAAPGEEEAVLERAFAREPVGTWLERLPPVGLSVQPCLSPETAVPALMSDAWSRDNGLSVTFAHEEVGNVTLAGTTLQLGRTPARFGAPARGPGSDFEAILSLADASDEADALIAEGIVGRPRPL